MQLQMTALPAKTVPVLLAEESNTKEEQCPVWVWRLCLGLWALSSRRKDMACRGTIVMERVETLACKVGLGFSLLGLAKSRLLELSRKSKEGRSDWEGES